MGLKNRVTGVITPIKSYKWSYNLTYNWWRGPPCSTIACHKGGFERRSHENHIKSPRQDVEVSFSPAGLGRVRFWP